MKRCIYCGASEQEERLECVSGDGGYGQPKAYSCHDADACWKRQAQQREEQTAPVPA